MLYENIIKSSRTLAGCVVMFMYTFLPLSPFLCYPLPDPFYLRVQRQCRRISDAFHPPSACIPLPCSVKLRVLMANMIWVIVTDTI